MCDQVTHNADAETNFRSRNHVGNERCVSPDQGRTDEAEDTGDPEQEIG